MTSSADTTRQIEKQTLFQLFKAEVGKSYRNFVEGNACKSTADALFTISALVLLIPFALSIAALGIGTICAILFAIGCFIVWLKWWSIPVLIVTPPILFILYTFGLSLHKRFS